MLRSSFHMVRILPRYDWEASPDLTVRTVYWDGLSGGIFQRLKNEFEYPP